MIDPLYCVFERQFPRLREVICVAVAVGPPDAVFGSDVNHFPRPTLCAAAIRPALQILLRYVSWSEHWASFLVWIVVVKIVVVVVLDLRGFAVLRWTHGTGVARGPMILRHFL